MITPFEALVARDSTCDVFFVRTGEAVSVVSIPTRVRGNHEMFLVEIEYSSGDRYTYPLSAVEPGKSVQALIDNGTYRESDMTYNATDSDGNCVTGTLTY